MLGDEAVPQLPSAGWLFHRGLARMRRLSFGPPLLRSTPPRLFNLAVAGVVPHLVLLALPPTLPLFSVVIGRNFICICLCATIVTALGIGVDLFGGR